MVLGAGDKAPLLQLLQVAVHRGLVDPQHLGQLGDGAAIGLQRLQHLQPGVGGQGEQ